MINKIEALKGFLFDWDGVFNSGTKGVGIHSTFSEADSMGLNLLRYAWYLHTGTIPYVAIITGENNETAFQLAKREHFNAVFYHAKHKIQVLPMITKSTLLRAENLAFAFDDVLDLSLAKQVGFRALVKREIGQYFNEYVLDNNLADYITSHEGGQHALREICEMLIQEIGLFSKTIEGRVAYEGTYSEYLAKRQAIETEIVDIQAINNL